MAITAPDIKLLESERMADTTDGGGRKTSRVIPDGVAGNIFPKVSRLDSVYGRVNLRKIYGAVQTADVDTYAGAHAIITDAPDNDRIHTTLFSTSSEFDTRVAARDRIESYVTKSAESRMMIIGRQLAGQQSVRVYQRVEEPLPEVGEVYCLSDEIGTTTNFQQYVRIADIAHEVRTYTDERGDFTRRVITLNIGVPLRYDFTGTETPARNSNVTHQSKVRDTTVVDAARYFGIKKLISAAVQNTLELSVESVYSPIVPTTNRETPVANAELTGASNPVAGSAAPISVNIGALSNGASCYLTRGAMPGSVVFSWGGGDTTDNGRGGFDSIGFVATIDYESGVVTRTGGNANNFTVAFVPAAHTPQPAHTADIPITIGNRGSVYLHTCNPLPSPGTFIADFRALGKWYRLRDQGDGTIKGADPAFGGGSIDYVSGSVVITLGALPDVESSVLFLWGSPAHYESHTNDVGSSMRQEFQLPDFPFDASTLTVDYTTQGIARTATCSATGVISGTDVAGNVNPATGAGYIEFGYPPSTGTGVTIDYSQVTAAAVTTLSNHVTGNNTGTIALGAEATPGTVRVDLLGVHTRAGMSKTYPAKISIHDDGAGFVVKDGHTAPCGTINYATGEILLTPGTVTSTIQSAEYADGLPWILVNFTADLSASGTYSAYFVTTHANPIFTPKSLTLPNAELALLFDLTKTSRLEVVPGSVRFLCTGKTYVDINGTLYTDVSTSTGAGVAAGSINYATGQCQVDFYNTTSPLAISVQSCTVKYGRYNTYGAYFRTNGSPIRPASFYVQVAAEDGELLTSGTDQTGNFTGSHIRGHVQAEMGVIRAEWGDFVIAAGNELQPWYKAENVVGLNVWKPRAVMPDTLRYSCVVLSNLPLNADILGLDPVRLPSDGRVPIFRPADVAVIHNTASFTLPAVAVASAVYNVGRSSLSEMVLVDQAGVKVPGNQYTVDLAAGTVTMAATLDLTGLVQPIIAKHRIEDLLLLTDVQINGTLSIRSPLPRVYPANTSFVSSALLFGDMNARVTDLHDELTFTGWSALPGSQATAQYNDIDYPIEILNDGAINETWRINFTSASAFQVIGANLGVIATGTVGVDCSPANALTGKPYFVIRSAGWGAGWSAGNQLRFNTIGAAAPIWIARTVLPGATLEGDSFSMQMRGDVDA